MAVVQSQYTLADRDIHLRDWRHARNLYYEYGLAFAPKTKFLYHCLFEPSPEVGNTSTANSFAFQKQIGVLVKTADLPSFRVEIDNKKQYNRIKQFQTRIDYSDVNITFHDDNLGVTRSLFEEYYKYNFLDGRHTVQKNALVAGPYASRDKYAPTVPKYGLNTGNEGPFFTSITLYQLSRQQYFAYTLVNPIITQWSHGNVDSSDGSGLNENTMGIAYEAVLYTHGDIGEDSQPVAFTDPETGYDQTPSPLSEPKLGGNQYISNSPKLVEPPRVTDSSVDRRIPSAPPAVTYKETNEYESLGNVYTVPKQDNQNASSAIKPPSESSYKTFEGSRIKTALSSSSLSIGNSATKLAKNKARSSFAAKAINAGELPYNNYTNFTQQVTSKSERDIIIDNLVDVAASGNNKLANLASEAMIQNGLK
jgi:hypothetical protein